MKRIDYKVLDNALITECDLLENDDFIKYYCYLNQINTLGQLLRKYDYKKLDFESKEEKDKISGFVDIIKYKYYGKKLSVDYDFILFDKFTDDYVTNGVKVWDSKYEFPLKRLGFTENEIRIINQFVMSDNNKSRIVINVILQMREMLILNKEYKGKEYDCLLKKFNIIYTFYQSREFNYDFGFSRENLVKVEKLLNRYKSLIENKKKIEDELNYLSKEISEAQALLNDVELSLLNDDMKKLLLK